MGHEARRLSALLKLFERKRTIGNIYFYNIPHKLSIMFTIKNLISRPNKELFRGEMIYLVQKHQK